MNTSDKKQQVQEAPAQATKVEPLNLIQTIKSVLWAMLGIQSKENLMRDFAHGKAINFIITGLLFVILFVLTLILAVNIVLSLAT